MDPKTPFLVAHGIAFALGLGGATILDLLLLRALRRPLEAELVQAFEFLANVVAVALAVLWISGIGFLVIYWLTDPSLLGNPKLWAKLTVVLILTLNGVFLHVRILPMLRRQEGRCLLEGLPWRTRVVMLSAGAISGVSWYYPFLLGIVRELNFAAPMATFLAAYGTAIAVTWLVAQLIGTISSPGPALGSALGARELQTRNPMPRTK